MIKLVETKIFNMNELENKLTKHFCNVNHINSKNSYKVFEIDARDLLSSKRLDLMSKITYIDSYINKRNLKYAISQYKKDIEAMTNGKFIEGTSTMKTSFNQYLKIFNDLIEDIKEKGFDDNKSLIPIGKSFEILDGAHRVSIAAYLGVRIKAILFENVTACYDYLVFRNKLYLEEKYIKNMALEYCKWHNNVFLLVFWPIVYEDKKRIIAESIVEETCNIVYKNTFYLSRNGCRNFAFHAYREYNWIGSPENHFKGLLTYNDICYIDGNGMLCYLIEAESVDKVIILKEKIRGIFDIGNCSIHSTDNQQETIKLAKLLLNENSYQCLNLALPDKYIKFFKLFISYKEFLVKNNYDFDRFIIDSSALLALCGIRKVGDIDFLTDYEECIRPENKLIENNQKYIKYHKYTVEELLYNPNNYFYFDELKFISFDNMISFKKNKGTAKDVDDINLLKKFLLQDNKNIKYLIFNFIITLKRKCRNVKYKMLHYIVIILKKIGLYIFIKHIYIKIIEK